MVCDGRIYPLIMSPRDFQLSARPTMNPQSINQNPFGNWTVARTLRWAIFTTLVVTLCGQSFVDRLKPSRYEVLDFYQEWSSARSLVTGRSIYATLDETVGPYLNLVKEPGAKWYWSVNVHPPTSVLLALPVQGIDYWNAFLVWNIASLLALGLSLWLIVRELGIRFTPRCAMPLLAGLLLCDPLRQQIIQGQLNLILLLIITGVWVADRRNHPILAGALAGLALTVKLYPGFLFVYFLFQRQWRALASGLASVLLLTATTALLAGPDAYLTYWREVMPTTAQWWSAWNNASLAGFWFKLFAVDQFGRNLTPLASNDFLARGATILSWTVVLALLIPVIWRARSQTERDHSYALTVTAMLLISPVTWEHYFLLLFLPLSLVWMCLPDSRVSRWILTTIVVVLSLPLMTIGNVIIPGGFFGGTASVGHTLLLLSLQMYALLSLFILHLAAIRPGFARMSSGHTESGITASS